ncbi:carboxypeptidase-like regulatory domain-containing protein [Gillisia limnaea]|uniref:SD-repeat containing protein B domain-containing protein n=1 Tax=Gillisia limnaea (strain DSM 15749 / LMG 21470 / R-8282) TaxID=865937 RepID=H2BW42_GILLR|nr:carboxypeptidase-like regulatory domain-containing protein [Gillisia limnaea]EHQ02959.1 hypothetical protein Gilli_2332 [Gillisia limnaea DSM 15749]
MEKKIHLLVVLIFIGSLFSGCEPAEESFIINEADSLEVTKEEGDFSGKLQDASLPAYFVAQLSLYESTLLNTYTMSLLGRVVKGAGENKTTTFNYRVSGNGVTPQLDSFYLEIPDCAGNLLSWTPRNSSNLQARAIKWNSSISKTGSQDYSVTYAGDVPLGIITATGIRGSIEETAKILGPCKDVFTLSGNVFIDADQDGEKEGGEFGLSGKNVKLLDGDGNEITTISTAADGSYSFMVLNGNYRISISEDFLNDNYYGIGDPNIDLQNITSNKSALNFGYFVNQDNIIYDLENNLLLDTQPTKFWVQEIRNASKKNASYSKGEIAGFLTAIENRLNSPFQFGSDKIRSALSILGNPIKTPFEEFIQQLLTAELNVISGRGVQLSQQERDAFHEALLTYSEGVACRENNQCSAKSIQSSAAATTTKLVSSRDTRMLSSFNGSGGI